MQPTSHEVFFHTLTHAASDPLPGTVTRGRYALARSEELIRGLGLADPEAATVFGLMQASIAELLRTIGENQ